MTNFTSISKLIILLNIKNYLNFFYNFNYHLKLLIYKINKHSNIFNNILFNNIKTLFKSYNLFNFKNKINFNKSNRSLRVSSKMGKARIDRSSSHILKNSTIWFGLRQLKLHKFKKFKYILITLLNNKKNKLIILNLELLKFIYNITGNNIKNYINLLNLNKNTSNNIIYNNINYNNLFIKNNNLNLIY